MGKKRLTQKMHVKQQWKCVWTGRTGQVMEGFSAQGAVRGSTAGWRNVTAVLQDRLPSNSDTHSRGLGTHERTEV